MIREAQRYADEVIVVEDNSVDGTGQVAERLGAKVVNNDERKGYVGAIKTGLRNASGEVIVTLDADGEHNPEDIPRLIEPVLKGQAELVLGSRGKITRLSERLINRLTNCKIRIGDSGTGFRAMTRGLALRLELKGKCTCGTLVLEADHYRSRVVEVPIDIVPVDKPRRIIWSHIGQIFYVLGWLIKRKEP